MTSTPGLASTRRQRFTAAALVLLIAPVVGVWTLVGAVTVGWPGLVLGLVLAPVLVLVLALYRATVRSTHSDQTRGVTREVGAAVLAVGFAFGTWVAALVGGVMVGVLPLFSGGFDDYPYEDLWAAGSLVVAVLTVPVMWWLLRTWADQPANDEAALT